MSDLRVFVYEYLSGGGAAADLTADDSGLREQGRAMRDAVVADLAHVDGVLVTYAAIDTPAIVPTRHVVAVAPGARESPAQFVRRQAAEHDCVWVIAPETEGVLAELRDCVADDRWVGCSAEAIRIAGSKRATRERLQASAIASTRDAAAGDAALAPGVRVVVKPDDGAGACETRVHATLGRALDDCSRHAARGRTCVAEVWEEGASLSLSVLCGPAGQAEVLSINRQRIDITSDGRVRYGGVAVDVRDYDASADAFAALARSVVRAMPGLRGYVGIDLVLRGDGHPVVVEINPRVTCAYVGLSAALVRNIAGEVLRQHVRIFEHAQP